MARGRVETVVAELAAPLVAARGLELVDVEYVKEGATWFLRLYIDQEGGVGLDDCEAVSMAVGPHLDAADPIPHAYVLEVSSPGVERPLRTDADYQRFAGRLVEVTTFAPVAGAREFVGHLVGLVDGSVHLKLSGHKERGREIKLPREQVAKARLRVEF